MKKFKFIEWHKFIKENSKHRKIHNNIEPLQYNPIFNNATATDKSNNDDTRELEKLKRKRKGLSR